MVTLNQVLTLKVGYQCSKDHDLYEIHYRGEGEGRGGDDNGKISYRRADNEQSRNVEEDKEGKREK